MRYFKSFETKAELQEYLEGQDLWLPSVCLVKAGWEYKRAEKENVRRVDPVTQEELEPLTTYDAPDFDGAENYWSKARKDFYGIPADTSSFVYYEQLDDDFAWVKTANETLYFWDRFYVNPNDPTDKKSFICTHDTETGELNIQTSDNRYAVYDNGTGELKFYNMGKLPDGADSTDGWPNYIIDTSMNALSVSPTTGKFSASSGSKTYTVTTTASQWTATSNNTDWCTITNKTATSFKVNVSQNNTLSPRNATVTVVGTNGDTPTVTIPVTQAAKSVSISVSPTELTNIPIDGSTAILTVTSNTTWTATSSDTTVCTLDTSTGSNNGTVTATISANTETTERTATINFVSTELASTTKTVNVQQQANPAPEPEPEPEPEGE